MAAARNPYIAGNPVGNSPAFVGRQDVLLQVLRVLQRPGDNAIVLYGQRRIGKTSILQHLAAQLPTLGSYYPVYFDLQDKASSSLAYVLSNLARTIAHTLDKPDPDLGPDPVAAFQDCWLPALLDDLPQGSSLVLLFDEFDVLSDLRSEQAAVVFFPYLRELLRSDPERLQFVFVIGRSAEDLTSITLSLFKGVSAQRISLLNQENTQDLVRLSEINGTLLWDCAAIERVWQLTGGHPYLTQQLCLHIWEKLYGLAPIELPTVKVVDVDAAVLDALEAARNTLEWLWDGLPPAERVVASAIAGVGPGFASWQHIEQLLHKSGVHIVISELHNAPRWLQDWDIIEPSDGGFRYRVELLRRWIADQKPLSRVHTELDYIEPVAENLYQAAIGLYRAGQLDQAVIPLRQAIVLNPNHVRGNQLLADILLAQGQRDEARQLLERLYEYQPGVSRFRLAQVYLDLARSAATDDERLAYYQQVLQLDQTQPEAIAETQRLLSDMEEQFSPTEFRRPAGSLDVAALPQHNVQSTPPSLADSSSSSNRSAQAHSVLIVTATKEEAQAVLEVFSQAAGKAHSRMVIGRKTYYNLGIYASTPVFMIRAGAATSVPGGALLAVRQAIEDLRPQAAIMCGIAFGLYPDKQRPGDVLVAKQILYLEIRKVDRQRSRVQRGDRIITTPQLFEQFYRGNIGWEGSQVHFGLILSGEKLVNDLDSRDWVLRTEPEAIGGEMEGAGLYAAAHDAKVDWILVKGIGDWADVDKDTSYQRLAARNAAHFVLHVLQLGGWRRSEQPLLTEQYDIAAIRNLLRDAFTASDLRRFCQDRPAFRPILDHFGLNFGLEDMIDVLIVYCTTRLILQDLLAEIRTFNPGQYERHKLTIPSSE